MKLKEIFIKVMVFDRIINEWCESYINFEKINYITIIIDDDERYNMVKFDDMTIRVDNESYDKLVEVLYGKTYN